MVPMVSLEFPLNIDAKQNTNYTNTYSVSGFCDVIITGALTLIKKFDFLR